MVLLLLFLSASQHKVGRLEIEYSSKLNDCDGLLNTIVVEFMEIWQSIASLDCYGNPLEKVRRLILIIFSRSYPLALPPEHPNELAVSIAIG